MRVTAQFLLLLLLFTRGCHSDTARVGPTTHLHLRDQIKSFFHVLFFSDFFLDLVLFFFVYIFAVVVEFVSRGSRCRAAPFGLPRIKGGPAVSRRCEALLFIYIFHSIPIQEVGKYENFIPLARLELTIRGFTFVKRRPCLNKLSVGRWR